MIDERSDDKKLQEALAEFDIRADLEEIARYRESYYKRLTLAVIKRKHSSILPQPNSRVVLTHHKNGTVSGHGKSLR